MPESGQSRVLTFDVGGSHVAAAVCYEGNFRLGPIARAEHASIATSAGFIDLLVGLGTEAASGLNGGLAAALAVPGPFDLAAGVSRMRHKLPFLYGIDLRQALSQRLGCAPDQLQFLNDADAYLLGELGAGAARGFDRVIGLTLGTGIGSAFAVGGKLVTAGDGVPNAGEIWDLPFENGIVEDFVSARALSAAYARRTGLTRSAGDLAASAPNDPAAREAFSEFGEHLGRVIGTLLAGFGADLLVLGGGISQSAPWFLPATRAQLQEGAPELRISGLMDRAALVGCGVAWFDGLNGASASGSAAPAASQSTAD
jgi:glucokinase